MTNPNPSQDRVEVQRDGNRATIIDTTFVDVRVLGGPNFWLWQGGSRGESQINLSREGAVTLANTILVLAKLSHGSVGHEK